ncbi:MAG: Phosphoribosyl 1,2-cyclic phosphodiesterase [Candidatus Aerophobetes bacterium ADurb.Bin490]|nr:MAG: Phosphoribosyl 1,2-cyclic phosphodiesterase [Candidatus Aerophobetes bacterium ADurb.Bin490]HPI04372.1 MBL fold metallo-hydrolase [Candidatus Goldiibacteriota bacterium]HPN64225.1 MBL fold metallo-hydrolase [Candidatus Goldiibacteriota bacterium]HRQ43138.1 MBL fold metallo-hydrolase [Candidatus Goldiibacteriota bacterium]
MDIKFLGTGTSHGVPVAGCSCGTCTSLDPKNRRYRTSLMIRDKGSAIIIDTPAEFRLRTLEYKIERIDALLITHAHSDHIAGLDDIRRYNELQASSIPAYCDAETASEIRKRFGYIFEDTQEGGGKPKVDLVETAPYSKFYVNQTQIQLLPVMHGEIKISAFKARKFAYVTDVSHIPEETFNCLKGVEVLVLDALRHEPHPTHFSVNQALEAAAKIKAKKVFFTHIAHALEHNKTEASLPEGVKLAYDGLELNIED